MDRGEVFQGLQNTDAAGKIGGEVGQPVKCREFAEFMSEYLSGALPAQAKAQFERHMSRCANCSAYMANYRKTIELGRQAFANDEADLPADVPDDLVRAILASRRTEP